MKNGELLLLGKIFFENSWIEGKKAEIRLKEKILDSNDLYNFIDNIDGRFCLITKINDVLYVVTDICRSITPFYRKIDTDLLISDDPSCLTMDPDKINKTYLDEIMAAGYVLSSETVVEGIKQVGAASVLVYDGRDINEKLYIDYKCDNSVEREVLFQSIVKQYDIAIEKLISYLNGRKAVIPLSGGLDSRFLLFLLKQHGYNNILAFTYGRKEQEEVLVSKYIAEHCNVDWIYIKYKRKAMRRLYKRNIDILYKKIGQYYTTPHLQDWYAVDYLFKNNYIDNNCVIVPGHAVTSLGELVSPDVLDEKCYSDEKIIKIYYAKNFIFNNKYVNKSRILRHFEGAYKLVNKDDFSEATINASYNLLKKITFLERQAKYIVNSVKLYEKIYSLDAYIPFYDRNLTELWMKVDINDSYHRKMYYEILLYRFKDILKKYTGFGHDEEIEKKKETSKIKEQIKNKFKLVYRCYYAYSGWFKSNMNLFYYSSFLKYIFHILRCDKSYVGMWAKDYADYLKKDIEYRTKNYDKK